MFRFLTALVFFACTFSVQAGENCTCKYKDSDIAEGQTICMNTANGSQMATCSRVLNNTSWKFLGQPCPTAKLQAPDFSNGDIETAQKLLIKRS